ncbi:MORC family CW-type zinc finger protein 3-like [Pseudochaenichthys georgianus]|uniref:MORC family CW-type zinc finger protein 3-like n=1 Tax=Pseudochaenichthys georgianus TaxID=52239 RepID=UPI0039C262BA
MAAQGDRGVPLSTLSPKYLHANSTSHTWPFSAIAELIDNAYDPDVNAKQFWIDTIVVKDKDCLSFMDNGYGLDKDKIHKMLSFGYSDKTPINGVTPIGMYGNGFKSESMRLGKDAIVFSKSKSVSCVGMLSQTYLEEIGANQIIFPIVCFERNEKSKYILYLLQHKASLQDILRYSPFNKEDEMLAEIEAISSHGSETGTRIIIWNLRSTSSRPSEFDFERDRYDFRIPSELDETMKNAVPSQATKSNTPESVSSLRAYCSILYLKPRMQIIIRGNMVKSQLIAKTLASVRKDHYKPTFLTKRIPFTFGYNTKSEDQYGIMMYHKNRLIKAYERVGCLLKANKEGVGVIGIMECFFLEPTHNKQSFDETDKYRKTMNNLGTKLKEYWNEIAYKKKQENPNSTIPMEDTTKRPDQNWAQCDECLRWRKLPDGIDDLKLPDKWYCRLNPDPQFRSCQAEEEREDSDDDLQPSYCKTYKLKEKEEQKAEEARKHQEALHLANVTKQKRAQIHPQAVAPPSTPKTCSPSSSDLPINPPQSKGKRTQPASPQMTPKRQRQNGFAQGKLDPSTSVNVIPLSSPSVLSDNENDDTDDDICILEWASTPKPNLTVDLTKVKTEAEQSDADVGKLMECSDDATLDNGPEINAAGTSSTASAAVGTSTSTAPPTEVSTSTTQITNQTEGEERVELSTSNKSDITKPLGVCSVEQSVIKEESSGDTTKRPDQNCVQCDEGLHWCKLTDGIDSDKLPEKLYCHLNPEPPFRRCKAEQEPVDSDDKVSDGVTHHEDSEEKAGPSYHSLTCQLPDARSRLQELISVKKESSNQASQTSGGTRDFLLGVLWGSLMFHRGCSNI